MTSRKPRHAFGAILRSALAQAPQWGFVTKNVAAVVTPPRVVREEVVPLTPRKGGGSTWPSVIVSRRSTPWRSPWGSARVKRWRFVGRTWTWGGTLRVRGLGAASVANGLLRAGVDPFPPDGLASTDLCRRAGGTPPASVGRAPPGRARWQDQDLVFPGDLGRPLDAHKVTRHFHALCEQAGSAGEDFMTSAIPARACCWLKASTPRVGDGGARRRPLRLHHHAEPPQRGGRPHGRGAPTT